MKAKKLKFIKLIGLTGTLGVLAATPVIMTSCAKKKTTSNNVNLQNVEQSLTQVKDGLKNLTYGYDIDQVKTEIINYLNKNSNFNNKLKYVSFEQSSSESSSPSTKNDAKLKVDMVYHFDKNTNLNGTIADYEVDNTNKTLSIKNIETNIVSRKNTGTSSLGFSEQDPYKISWDILKLNDQYSYPKTKEELENLFKDKIFADTFSNSIGLQYGIDFEYTDFEFSSVAVKNNKNDISYTLKLKPKAKLGSEWRENFNLWKDKEQVFELSEKQTETKNDKAGTSYLPFKNYGLDWSELFKDDKTETYPKSLDEAKKIFSNKWFMIVLSNRILEKYHEDFENVQFNFKSIEIKDESNSKNGSVKYKLIMQVVSRPGYEWHSDKFGSWKDKDLTFELSNNTSTNQQ
ncbi:hypothetical protein [Malacoplasma iowae]|uniref:p35 lipoprotein family protein n=1 Tax=Malacoplasma iowae DK-CPA TaxID=1394179 RepID=A0A084U361_MALIO|nr:hypothetical protein [Malacoplasma iowae]KFB07397.1 P35 lipoprotein family protein [Malacoplasma iowae DK-CPA]WPL36549.1 hypothetical protein QX179_03940 [Malacoplasma iowae]WPL38281.1 hypothetical protein QX182_02040 [Malacoplasma iowae]WPL41167.1 hypothetical protein QX184_01025 [Malacoplasma iowae]